MNTEHLRQAIDAYTAKLAENAQIADVNWNEYLRWLREEIEALRELLAQAEAEQGAADWTIRQGASP
jgi:hypothetical protein